MSRITTVTDDIANSEQAELFAAIKSNLGIVPNFLRVFANSPDALKAFLGFHHIAGNGSLDAETRERSALTLAQKNECEYCLSAHTAIGRKTGLNSDEINSNRNGDSQDAKAAVAVRFSRSLVEHLGDVTTAEVEELRDAGFSDADIVEIITHTGINLLTNILSKASRIDIDFPRVDLNQAA
jgi:uncharacterized peroxidase-related enzyme